LRAAKRLAEADDDDFGDVDLLGAGVVDHAVESDALRGAPRTAEPAIDGQPGYPEAHGGFGDGQELCDAGADCLFFEEKSGTFDIKPVKEGGAGKTEAK